MTDTGPGPPDVGDEPTGFAKHLKAALVGAHDHLADVIDGRKRAHLVGILDQFEDDLAPLVAPFIEQIAADPKTPAHVRDLLNTAGRPKNATGSLVVGFALGSIIGPVLNAAVEPFVATLAQGAWDTDPSRVVTPDVAVAAVLKGVLDFAAGATFARLSGFDDKQFSIMVDAAGNALGFGDALLLQRRGQLVGVTLEDVLQYSNVNPRFYASALNLIYTSPPQAEVIAGRLKNHLGDGQARGLFEEAGGNPDNFDWMLATAGRPYSPTEALLLWNREEIDEAAVDQVIAQSDINPDFAADFKKTRHYYPPPRSIVPMLRSQAITEAQARKFLSYYGANDEIVQAFIAEAQHSTTAHAKALTQTQIVASYEARLIDRPTAEARIVALGYPQADATILLDLGDEKRTVAMLNAGIRSIGTKYVAHKLTKPDAAGALGGLQVPPPAQHDLFTVWDVERDANMHLPTVAGIVGAFRRGLIDAPTTKMRLVQLGVDEVDIPIFVVDGFPPTAGQEAIDAALSVLAGQNLPDSTGTPAGPKPKNLTATQIEKLWLAGAITQADAVAKLVALGYDNTEAEQLLFLAAGPTP